MPGGAARIEPLSKRERERMERQMTDVVKSLKRIDKNVEKMVQLTAKLVGALGGSR